MGQEVSVAKAATDHCGCECLEMPSFSRESLGMANLERENLDITNIGQEVSVAKAATDHCGCECLKMPSFIRESLDIPNFGCNSSQDFSPNLKHDLSGLSGFLDTCAQNLA